MRQGKLKKAIAGSADHDEAMGALVAEGRSETEIYEALALEDIQHAADILRPVYDWTDGVDGYVSLEVSPTLAHETEGTVGEARQLFAAMRSLAGKLPTCQARRSTCALERA
jgi:transaldolase